jgi:glycosyltransferase involved in cell wall biosynthesis
MTSHTFKIANPLWMQMSASVRKAHSIESNLAPGGVTSGRGRVVMLVSNPCVNDTRVIRAAETVSQQGFETVVLALSDQGETSEEQCNGVLYRRLARPQLRSRARRDRAMPTNAVSNISTYDLALSLLGQGTELTNVSTSEIGSTDVRGRSLGFFPISLEISRRLFARSHQLFRRTIYFAKALIIPRFHFVLFRPVLEARRMRKIFESEVLKLSPQIIHAHDLVMLPAGAATAKTLGAKLVYDAHELEVHRNTKTGATDKWLRSYLEKKHIKKCDAVVTVCDSIADHLSQVYTVKRPVVVMNAPDVDQRSQRRQSETDLRSSLGLTLKTPLAIYVGRITVGRGIEQSVEALQYLPEYHLALVGPANQPTVEGARELAATLGVAGRLHVVAPVAPGMIIPFISSGDVSLVPIQNVCLSYYYCLPNKLLESAMARLPVVVSNFPELRRFVEVSGSGVVMDETDPRDIARAIQEAYENRNCLVPGPDRLHQAEEIYGWQTQRRKLQELYATFDLSIRSSASGEAGCSAQPRT